MTDFQKQLQELVDQAAEKEYPDTMESYRAAFKQGCEFLMPVLMKAVEQRDDAIWNRFRSKEEYSKVFFATDLEDIMDKELLNILKGDG
jgi:hypothetical protein